MDQQRLPFDGVIDLTVGYNAHLYMYMYMYSENCSIVIAIMMWFYLQDEPEVKPEPMDDEDDQGAEAQDNFNYDNTQSEESEAVSTKSWHTCTGKSVTSSIFQNKDVALDNSASEFRPPPVLVREIEIQPVKASSRTRTN